MSSATADALATKRFRHDAAMPATPPDFRLYHGNDLELLAALLARQLAEPVPGAPLLEPDTILIPQPAMRRWLQKTLAETHGVAANLRFLAPGQFVREALDGNVPGAADDTVGDAATMRWRLWRLLDDPNVLEEPVFAPLQAVLAGPDRSLAAWGVAGELADAFEKYQAWRRDWLRRWDQGAARDDWQAELWRRATRGLSHRGKRLDAYLGAFGAIDTPPPSGLPRRLFAFACQNVSPDVLRVIASAARAGPLHFFFLSPVAGWWGDLQTARERLHADPSSVFNDDENPLLRDNGAAGRDFVRLLFSYEVAHPSAEFALYVPPDPAQHTGLLHRLQRDLLARNSLPAAGDAQLPVFDAGSNEDHSLQVHACHTRLREVQVLHDQLRAMLERDPALQARDIAVLTPDIDAYAPHVHAVFGGYNERLQRIPYALSDCSVMAGQPLAEAFLRLLDLPVSRFTVNEVLELLQVPAIAQRLRLDANDFESLRGWLGEAGARWGIDASHRAQLGAPAEDAYSWAFALDRLLLGHASGDDADLDGVAPWPMLEGSALTTLDALLQGVQGLIQCRLEFANPQPAAQWQSHLSASIDRLFATHPADPQDRRTLDALRAHIASFAQQVDQASVHGAIPRVVVRAWFAAVLGDSDARQPFLTGGVTFGRMVPMRLVPFKVICLLGMNDGDYPRRDPQGSMNRLGAELLSSQRLIGDRSIRDEDRGLFLQLFAAATQVFYVSYLGQDARSGDSMPPSVVVSELLDTASRYFRDAPAARADMTIDEPLQPFSAEAFGRGDARRVSYQARWCEAAQPMSGVRTSLPRFVNGLPAPAPATDALPSTITRAALYRGLGHPAREFLCERVGLRIPEASERLADAEPFDSRNGLHRYALTQRVFDALVSDDGSEHGSNRAPLCARVLAEGLVAPGAAGVLDTEAMLDQLAPAARTWRSWGPSPARSQAYQIELGRFVLSGTLPRVHADGLRQFSASSGHGKTQLALGIDALVWSALGRQEPIRRLVNGDPPVELQPLIVEDARERLHALLLLLERARANALPFMPKAGLCLFVSGDTAAGWKAAHAAWTAEHGEGCDPWVQLALRGADPFTDKDPAARGEFLSLATQVFGRMPGLVGGVGIGGVALDD